MRALELVDGRILAVLLVADLRLGHRREHRRGRLRERVRAEVDHAPDATGFRAHGDREVLDGDGREAEALELDRELGVAAVGPRAHRLVQLDERGQVLGVRHPPAACRRAEALRDRPAARGAA